MSKERFEVLTEAKITNNCPECFNQEMKLTFKQKHKFGKLYDRTTNEIVHELKCNTCNSVIYPVNWTDDIERSFNYYQKTVTPQKATIKFTSLFYILIVAAILLIITAVVLLQSGVIQV